jgi:transcriptional regulator with XRE-family HTH domain
VDSDLRPVAANLTSRIQSHFDNEEPDEVVRRSEQLMLCPEESGTDVAPSPPMGPVLIHPRPKRIPLSAYLASALTGLEEVQKALIVHLSDITSLVCRAVDIELYEPRKKTDPVHHANVPDAEVFKTDRERVVSSDLLIHLCHFPSTGSGGELGFAYDALVPMILIAPGEQRVSRMITGIPSLKIEIRYEEPEDLRAMLEDRLIEIRPLLEQRRLTMSGFSENVVGARIKELRLDANLSREDLASRVGLTSEGLADIEENIDTVSNPSLTKLRLIATALKTTVAELVNPDYHEAMLASIQSLMSEKTAAAAARFTGMSDKDKRALLRRFLARVSNELEERWLGL